LSEADLPDGLIYPADDAAISPWLTPMLFGLALLAVGSTVAWS
jgi:hypothetical protein